MIFAYLTNFPELPYVMLGPDNWTYCSSCSKSSQVGCLSCYTTNCIQSTRCTVPVL